MWLSSRESVEPNSWEAVLYGASGPLISCLGVDSKNLSEFREFISKLNNLSFTKVGGYLEFYKNRVQKGADALILRALNEIGLWIAELA